MSSNRDGQFVQMNAMTDVTDAERFARYVEDAEATRLGVKLSEARPVVARRLGASPGTLENLRRGRLKIIPNFLMARIRSEFVAVLQSEVTRLEHEIALARQTGMDHRENDLAAAQTQLVAAKKILGAS